MVKSKWMLLLVCAVAIGLAQSDAQAAWRWPKPLAKLFGKKGPKRIDYIVVTGNYVKSRLLAELIQHQTGQPILLLPSGGDSDVMYFIPPKHESSEVVESRYVEFVNFLNPKKVLFLGNAQYAAPKYLELLHDSEVVTWSTTNDDWEQIAYSVGDLLKLKNLYIDYLVLLHQMDEHGNVIPPSEDTVYGGFITKGKKRTFGDGDEAGADKGEKK